LCDYNVEYLVWCLCDLGAVFFVLVFATTLMNTDDLINRPEGRAKSEVGISKSKLKC
jgi:hypothetical protein